MSELMSHIQDINNEYQITWNSGKKESTRSRKVEMNFPRLWSSALQCLSQAVVPLDTNVEKGAAGFQQK